MKVESGTVRLRELYVAFLSSSKRYQHLLADSTLTSLSFSHSKVSDKPLPLLSELG